MQPAVRDGRIDGLRGLCGIAVVASHYLAELPSGNSLFEFGFIAVTIFFVMSGFLIGRLIMERGQSANFFQVFYARRLLRTVPSYIIVVGATVLASLFPFGWAPHFGDIPALSYFTFTQNLFMGSAAHTGNEWLGPTWTLAVEEQFYLVAPLAIVLLSRNGLVIAIGAAAAAAVAVRFTGALEAGHPNWHLLSLIGRADALAIGVGAAVLSRTPADWRKWDRLLELAPLACLASALVFTLLLGRDVANEVTTHLLVAIGSAAYMLRLAHNDKASPWLGSWLLVRTGHQSYSLYLVHMPVAIVVHGLLFGAQPDIASPPQLASMALCTIITILLSLALTKTIEDPAMALGRRLRWSTASRSTATAS